MQEILVILIVATASLWLSRNLWKRVTAPPCQPPSETPAGTDGFVPLEDLGASQKVR